MVDALSEVDMDTASTSPIDPFVYERGLAQDSSVLVGGSELFWVSKRAFDICAGLFMAPLVGLIALALLLANPFRNPGPVFFLQRRMGRDGAEFTALKFRTMLPTETIARGPEDPLETWRITPLGHWLRRTRIDELPQFLNVLIGQMSVIGPRPDFIDHAQHFCATVPGYRERHVVRPGISGLAQVNLGYAEGASLTRRKTEFDHTYIERAGWRMDARILLRTLVVMATGFGAR